MHWQSEFVWLSDHYLLSSCFIWASNFFLNDKTIIAIVAGFGGFNVEPLKIVWLANPNCVCPAQIDCQITFTVGYDYWGQA